MVGLAEEAGAPAIAREHEAARRPRPPELLPRAPKGGAQIVVRGRGVADVEAKRLAHAYALAHVEHPGLGVASMDAPHQVVAPAVVRLVLVDDEAHEDPLAGE